MNAQLMQLLANQRTNAALHGDEARIDWYEAADHTAPEQH